MGIVTHCSQECVAQTVKNQPAMQETWVRSLGWEDSLEKGMATYSNILPWRIPWTEESGGLQSMGFQRVGHDWVTDTFSFSETKSTLRHNLSCQINKNNFNKPVGEQALLHVAVRSENSSVPMRRGVTVLRAHMHLPFDLTVLLLEIYPADMLPQMQNKCRKFFYCCVICNDKIVNTT